MLFADPVDMKSEHVNDLVIIFMALLTEGIVIFFLTRPQHPKFLRLMLIWMPFTFCT